MQAVSGEEAESHILMYRQTEIERERDIDRQRQRVRGERKGM